MLIQSANLAFRFFLELCALGAIADWGYHVGSSTVIRIALALVSAPAGAVLWALFGSPKAYFPIHGILRLAFELAFFGLAVAALAKSGQPGLAATLGIAFLLNLILLRVWKQV